MKLLISAILTYAVMVIVSFCLVLSGAVGQERIRQRPIPWQYDYPYRGMLFVRYVDPHKTHEACVGEKPTARTGYAQACQFDIPSLENVCIIILPKDNGTYTKQHLLYLQRHEIAHCNGWTHD